MSSHQVTVRELIARLRQFDPNAFVAVLSYEENWRDECLVDGPHVFQVKMAEIRSGWTVPEAIGMDESDYLHDVVVLSDTLENPADLRELLEDEGC